MANKVVVIDPGHGGSTTVGGSSPNNATAQPSGTLEKTMTLTMAKLVREKLLEQAEGESTSISVILTRETDMNVGISARANVARDTKADVFVSIHYNSTP